MEDFTSLSMMDSVEGKSQRCFEGKQSNMQNFKTNCLVFYNFWCKQKVLGQTDNFFDV